LKTTDGDAPGLRILDIASIMECPHLIMLAEHYRSDGTCRCDDETHTVMAEWDYEWDGAQWV
jgi:hypothetical protein